MYLFIYIFGVLSISLFFFFLLIFTFLFSFYVNYFIYLSIHLLIIYISAINLIYVTNHLSMYLLVCNCKVGRLQVTGYRLQVGCKCRS